MSIRGTVIKLAIFAVVLAFFTAAIIVVFGQIRFDRTNSYTAEFINVSGLREGQFVRASGVEIGKVKSIELADNGHRAEVKFDVDRSVPLYQSTTAQIRYLDLIGNRYLELKRGQGQGVDQLLIAGRIHSAVSHFAGAGSRRADRWFQATVSGLGSAEGQQHRLCHHHRLPGTGRNHQRHPRPDCPIHLHHRRT